MFGTCACQLSIKFLNVLKNVTKLFLMYQKAHDK